MQDIASQNTGVLGWTGVIALGALIWTAIGFVTYARRAVRDIFGLPPDRRSYVLLKARDLLAAAIFGIALVLGAALGSIGTWALSAIVSLIGLSVGDGWVNASIRTGSIIVGFADHVSGARGAVPLPLGRATRVASDLARRAARRAGISILQLGAGLLLSYTPSNPLLATFAIFIGLLLWFRLIGIVMLVSAAWIAVAAKDRNVALLPQTEAERVAAEHAALLSRRRSGSARRRRPGRTRRGTAPGSRIAPFATRRRSCARSRHRAPPPPAKSGILG